VPLDSSFIGYSYPPAEPYLASREKIREFADAIGAPEPWYRDVAAAQAAGYPDLIAPPTFAAVVANSVATLIREDEKLGVDFARVVHGDQRIAFSRPIFAGDRLVARGTIETITARGGHEFLTYRTDVADESGAAVLSVWTLFVVRGEA
jgi:acyl dehydratase